ncbi:MAG: universal stress protein [Frankiaceae bacterium]|jgi:nucleotide-binding universal stress UspA family protein|nr:universal stress protein [Frankiaceae bacterium]
MSEQGVSAPDADANRVVVGVDGSEPSKLALRWAAELAPTLGARVEAVAAWHSPSTLGYSYIPDGWRPDLDAEKLLTATVAEVFGDQRPEGLRMLTIEGNPAEVLICESATAKLIVVGSRGHGGFVGLMIGSVSASTAEHAKCPVLVVH